MKKLNALLLVCFAAVFASTLRAQTSGINNAELKGDYAFNFNGFSVAAGGAILSSRSLVFAAVGRFTADGAGNLTNGELDANGIGSGAVFTQQPFTGTYTIGADNRGMMTMNIAGVAYQLAFAMTADGNAQFIEFDPPGGSVGSGSIVKADRTAFSTAKITGDYAFGLAGFDASNNRMAFAGRQTSDGAGNLTNEVGDINAHGTFGSATFTSAIYTVSDSTNGRGTTTMGYSFGGTSYTSNFVFYIVNSEKLFAMETDPLMGSTPLLSGVVLQQQTPSGGFSNASLQGNVVTYLTGLSYCSTGFNPSANVIVGLLAADGNGGLTLTFDENCGGIAGSASLPGTYSVTTSGRTSMAVGNGAVAYLSGTNNAFILGNDGSVFFGFGEPQAAGPLANNSVLGSYAGLATNPATAGVTIFSGEFNADGASPTGNLTGTEDIDDAATGQISGAPFAATYSISSSPTNGRGAVTMTSKSGTMGVEYVISSSKFLILPLNDPNPSVWLFEH
jgi:hypothetical protein